MVCTRLMNEKTPAETVIKEINNNNNNNNNNSIIIIIISIIVIIVIIIINKVFKNACSLQYSS